MKLDTAFLEQLDLYAYNAPDKIPAEIQRTDKAVYRIYFRFMCLVYLLYRNNILGKDALTRIKKEFISDLTIYNGLFRIWLTYDKWFRHIREAVIGCNKNKNNCPACMELYRAQVGYTLELEEEEADINLSAETYSVKNADTEPPLQEGKCSAGG